MGLLEYLRHLWADDTGIVDWNEDMVGHFRRERSPYYHVYRVYYQAGEEGKNHRTRNGTVGKARDPQDVAEELMEKYPSWWKIEIKVPLPEGTGIHKFTRKRKEVIQEIKEGEIEL